MLTLEKQPLPGRDNQDSDPRNGRARGGWSHVVRGLLEVYVARAAQKVRERHLQQSVAEMLLPSEHPAAAIRTTVDNTEEATTEAAGTEPAPTRPWDITKMVFKEYGRDNGSLMAAAVAFYLLLSVIPMTLLGVALLGFLIKNPSHAIDQTFAFLNQFLPIGRRTIRPLIMGIIQARGSLGIAGFVGLALTATGGFATLENAINVMWNQPNRNFIMNKIFAFLMMLVIGALFALSLGSTLLVALAARQPGLHWLANGWLKPILGVVTPLLSSTLMFAVIYRFYPNGKSGWRTALISGAITACLWEVFKYGYGIYASRDSSPYGVMIGLVMWIYYSSTLILMGSELTWILEGCPGREGKEQVHAHRGRERKPGEAT